MTIKKKILSKKEKSEEQSESCPERDWFRKMQGIDKARFICMLLIDPAFVAIVSYYLTDMLFHVLLAYVLVDTLLVLWYRDMEIKRLSRIEELKNQGDRMPIIRQKIQELKEIEAEMKKSGNR